MKNLKVLSLAAIAVAVFVLNEPSHAAISTWGDNSAHYNGPGPWNVSDKLTVGDTAAGGVSVTDSSTMTTSRFVYTAMEPNSSGTVNLDGGKWYANSWSGVGYGGVGVVNISNGGYWRTDYETRVYMGEESTASGTVNISGGSWRTRGRVYIGSAGKAVINITGGSMTVDAAADLYFGSQGKIILDGGQLNIYNYTNLPGPDKFDFRSGTLLARYRSLRWNNAVLANGCNLRIDSGYLNTSSLIAVAGSTVTMVGRAGLSISENGYAAFNSPLTMASDARVYLEENAQLLHSLDMLELNGGRVKGKGQVIVGAAGVNLGTEEVPGTLMGQEIYEYDEWTDEYTLVGYDPLVVYGNVSGTGTLTGVTVHGAINVGDSPGWIGLEYCALAGASIEMEVGGLTTDMFDQLICGPDVDFALGRIRVVFAEGYEPQPGDEFQLFVSDTGADLPGSLALASFDIPENCSFDEATGVMTAIPEPSTLVVMITAGVWLVRRRSPNNRPVPA